MGEIGARESCRERGEDSLLRVSKYEFAASWAVSAWCDAIGVNPFMASRAACLGLYARDAGPGDGEFGRSFCRAVGVCQP